MPAKGRAPQPRQAEHVLAVGHGLEDLFLDPRAVQEPALLRAAQK